MDAKEMEQLLREGAYAVLLEDDADAIKEFYEQVTSSARVCNMLVVVGIGPGRVYVCTFKRLRL
jgi:hypothetical protein